MNSKKRPNKLDRYAEQLDGWLGVEKITLDEALERLVGLGCSSSRSSLSVWWQRRYQEQCDAEILRMIVSGKQRMDKVKETLKENPAPEFGVIEEMVRVLTMQLVTQGFVNPELLEMADRFTGKAIEFLKEQGKEKDRALAREKFEALEAKVRKAREELRKLSDPKAQSSEEERKAIVDKVDEVLGLK
jgi:hypothetical protein